MAGEIQVPPAIEDTISDDSPTTGMQRAKAMKSFNASISSSGGRATISVEIPTINRNIGTVEPNDTVVVLVRNTIRVVHCSVKRVQPCGRRPDAVQHRYGGCR